MGLQKNKKVISNFEGNDIDIFSDSNTDKSLDKSNNNMNTSENITTRKKILGTAYYMAPEIIKEEPITNAVDYWALGI